MNQGSTHDERVRTGWDHGPDSLREDRGTKSERAVRTESQRERFGAVAGRRDETGDGDDSNSTLRGSAVLR